MTNTTTDQQKPPHISRDDYTTLSKQARSALALVTVGLSLLAISFYVSFSLDRSFLVAILGTWTGILIVLWRGLAHHGHAAFGSANLLTSVRAAGASLLTGLVLIPDVLHASLATTTTALWAISLSVTLLIALDGVDGYLARREKLMSIFGARFDMEVDAFLALVIALILWRTNETGLWVLGLGLMRYVFVVSSWFLAPLRASLFPSMRRKVVCVIQLGALCLMLSPLIDGVASTIVGGIALVCLTYSFLVDIVWLYRRTSF